jgi:hypothetical protein
MTTGLYIVLAVAGAGSSLGWTVMGVFDRWR